MIRVIIADDHAVVREGIKRILAGTQDIQVIAEAGDGPKLLAAIAAHACDVAVMDMAMPGMPGLEVLQEIRRIRSRLPVLVLSMYPADQYGVRALVAGAWGYLHKGDPPDQLLSAIRTVATGRRFLTDDLAQSLALHVDSASAKRPHELLSNREYQVFALLASGRSVTDAARELNLSVKTVSTFRRRLLEKLGVRRNADIIRYAIDHSLLQ